MTQGWSNSGTAGVVSAYDTVQKDGTPVTQRNTLNFVGANFAVYDSGGVTTVSGSAVAGGSAHVIQNAGTPLTQRANLNVLGGLVAYDDVGNNATIISGSAHFDANALHTNVSGEVNALSAKAAAVDDDVFMIEDSAASFAKKKVAFSAFNASEVGRAYSYRIS